MRISSALALLIFSSLISHLTSPVLAKDYQQCNTSSTCTIGEFLYNDDYTALTGQSCTLTAKYPDGTAFLTSQAMTGRADGWYSYDASIGTTTGLYTATICCVPSSGTMCLDKSFEVKAATTTLTAADVWSYNNRSLTSFGSLVSDIWSASTRSLTTFGDLVGNIWGSGTRTLTSTTENTQITNLQADIDEQRLLLEKAITEPVITLEMYDSSAKLSSKLDAANSQVETLSTTITALRTDLLTAISKWDTSSNGSKITLASTLAAHNDALIAATDFFTSSWDNEVTANLKLTSSTLSSSLRALKANATKNSLSDLTSILTNLNELESVVGDASTSGDPSTLLGLISSFQARAELLSDKIKNIDSTLKQWSKLDSSTQASLPTTLQREVLSVNEYVGATSMISTSSPKNTLLSLRAILNLNQQLLASSTGSPVMGMWLEDGSIVYKASVYNPSQLISLDVPLSFYLPKEAKTEHILSQDSSLTINFDPDHDALKVAASLTLSPLDTKIVQVQLEDIWQIDDSALAGLASEASTYLNTLANSNFYAQGLTYKNELDKTIASIKANQDSSLSPSERIQKYRENQLALLNTKQGLGELKNLVAQVENSRSLKGFIGGATTASSWGIIIVILAGFVMIGLYIYKTNAPVTPNNDQPLSTIDYPLTTSTLNWANLGIASFTIIAVLGGVYLMRQQDKQLPPAINEIVAPTTSPTLHIESESSLDKPSSTTSITPPIDGSVNIRNKPSTSADIVMSIKEDTEVIVFSEQGDWSQIGFSSKDETKGYWVKSEYLNSN